LAVLAALLALESFLTGDTWHGVLFAAIAVVFSVRVATWNRGRGAG
jgi:hypothetical protein